MTLAYTEHRQVGNELRLRYSFNYPGNYVEIDNLCFNARALSTPYTFAIKDKYGITCSVRAYTIEEGMDTNTDVTEYAFDLFLDITVDDYAILRIAGVLPPKNISVEDLLEFIKKMNMVASEGIWNE